LPLAKPSPTSEKSLRNPLRFWRWRIVLIALVTMALLFALRKPLLAQFGIWLYATQQPVTSDVIIVLGGETGHRVLKGIELYNAGYANRIAITGTGAEFPRMEPAPYKRWLYLLEKKGVPADSIDVLAPSNSTYDDAMLSRDYLEAGGYRSALVVTSPYHTRRAGWVFDRMKGDRDWRFRLIACEQRGLSPKRWWRDERQFLWVVNEYVKLAYYGWAYGLWGSLEESDG